MSDMFPSTMALSEPIQVGAEFLRPAQWAAKLAPKDPPGSLIIWKNALIWLEGEKFGDQQELIATVLRVIDFQAQPQGGPPPLEVQVDPPEPEAPEGKQDVVWQTQSKKVRKPKVAHVAWSATQLGAAIVQAALVKFGYSFRFAGPSLDINEVYQHFQPNDFTYPALIAKVRDALAALPSPNSRFGVSSKAIYSAASSPGKGRNLNIKVQEPDKSKPNGYSAVAQIHVIWQ